MRSAAGSKSLEEKFTNLCSARGHFDTAGKQVSKTLFSHVSRQTLSRIALQCMPAPERGCLGYRLLYICYIFVHPDLDSAPMFVVMLVSRWVKVINITTTKITNIHSEKIVIKNRIYNAKKIDEKRWDLKKSLKEESDSALDFCWKRIKRHWTWKSRRTFTKAKFWLRPGDQDDDGKQTTTTIVLWVNLCTLH